MSREILFKAKRKDNREWVKGCLIVDYVTGQYFIHQYGDSVNESQKNGEEGCLRFVAFEIDSDTLCQYIGLLDKNGKKIWENDICEMVYDGVMHVYIVIWDKEELDFKGTNGKENYGENFEYLGCCEEIVVIGNIFDNPELLEENAHEI